MSIRTLGRCGAAFLFAAFIAGCSMFESGGFDGEHEVEDARVATPSLACRLNRASCIHEGRYESGERGYAEQEARRLNQASIERLRRMGK